MKQLMLSLAVASALASSVTMAGTIRIAHDVGYAGAESLDPISPSRFFDANQMLYSRLLRQGTDGQPSADIATKWSASSDAKTWTFTLREGVKFHDGSDLTASDVKYTLDRIQDPKIDSPVAAVLSVIEKVEIIDDYKFVIKLTAPHADLPLLLMDYRVRIIPEDSGESIAKTGVGSGPFMLDELDPEGTTVLKANPNYWEGAPAADDIEIIGIPDSQARIQALMAGQIDLEHSIGAQQKRLLANSSQFKLYSIATGEWRALVFRTDIAPMDNVKVRKALRLAVDREEMLRLVSGEGAGTVTCDHPVWSGDQYRTEIECPQNISEAKKLLQEAGYPDGVEVTISTADNEPEWVRMVEVLQQQVAKAGITIKLNMVPSDGYWSDVWMKHPAVATRWSQRPADQILNEAFRSTATWNETFFKKPDFDAALDKARSELSFDKRKALYAELQKTLWEEGGALIPYHLNQTRATRSNVTGLAPVETFSIRWNLVDVK